MSRNGVTSRKRFGHGVKASPASRRKFEVVRLSVKVDSLKIRWVYAQTGEVRPGQVVGPDEKRVMKRK